MNIKVQLCGLIIVLFLFALSRTHKKLSTDSEKAFTRMLFLSITGISLDILSIVAIYFKDRLSLVFVDAVCKSYLVSLIWIGWSYFCYVILDLNFNLVFLSRTRRIAALITGIECIVIAVLPIKIFADGEVAYSYDLAVYSTYVFAIIDILSAFSVSIYVLLKKNSRRGMAMLMTTVVWIIAALIQFINNELLLVGFAMAAGVMIVFIVLDNPDLYYDKDLRCFNAYALSTFVSTKLFRGENFALLDMSINDLKSLQDKDINIKNIAKKVISLIDGNRNVKLFKNLNAEFILVVDSDKEIKNIISLITGFLSQYPDISKNLTMFVVDNALELDTTDNLYKCLAFIRNKKNISGALITYSSNEVIRKYTETQNIEKEIKNAILEDRVEVFFQPIQEISKKRPSACEALVRIRNLDGTLMSPGVFIPVAEDTGLVKEIGEVVLDKVCKFLKDSDAIKLGIEKVHVNLSAIQCDDNQTAAKLISIIEKNQIETKYINFEITETAVSSNKEALLENMNALISKGFSFSLDDFGKGESNLMYIVDLPVDELKIDIDLSKAFFINSKAKIVVRAIASMAKMLNVPLVAEGIENEVEFSGIKSEGITHIQGYFFSKPLPPKEFIEYLENSENRTKIEKIIKESENETGKEFAKIKLNGKNVLLVEDNELNAMIESEVLSAAGFNVEVAKDGVFALDIMSKLDSKKYDVILMDISMPIMDGFETTRRIRSLQNKFCTNIPIIALSAMNMEELKIKALKVGMSNQLCKPFSLEDLKNIIEC